MGCHRVFAFLAMGADTKANASRGSGALEGGDLRLLENGSERRGAVVSNVVFSETAKARGRMEAVREYIGVSTALTRKQAFG